MDDKKKEKHESGGESSNTVTRRKWLIDIGKAAALAGIAGTAGTIETEASAATAASSPAASELPPGLYSPSLDHLTHAMSSDSRYHPIPPGSPTDFVRPRSGPYQPQFFSPEEYRVIHRLTALMLGESPASQGGIVDEVAEWVDLWTFSYTGAREAARKLTPEQRALAEAYDGAPLLHELESTDPQKTYRDGLAWLAAEAMRQHQRPFIDLTEEEQAAILDRISDERTDTGTGTDGTRFFKRLKHDIIDGFYTSQTGLKELDYKGNAFYAESPGCSSPVHPHPKT